MSSMTLIDGLTARFAGDDWTIDRSGDVYQLFSFMEKRNICLHVLEW